MSMVALLQAVQTQLRAAPLSYAEAQCGVQPDGMPNPAAGQVYVSVWPGSVTNQQDLSLDEEVELNVTLTLKSGYLPDDRWGPQLLVKATTGLYARAEAIRAVLHMNYTVMNNANAGQSYSIGAGDNGFIEPLKFQYMGPPEPKDASWFQADGEGNDPPCGFAITLRFGGARRVQVIEEQS